jgi:hypothetical protein
MLDDVTNSLAAQPDTTPSLVACTHRAEPILDEA